MAWDWIKQIDQTALELEEKPQFGKPFEFSWTDFEGRLKQTLDAPLSVTHHIKGWQSYDQLLNGMGKELRVLAIQLTPLSTPAFLATTLQDLQETTHSLLGGEEGASFFFDANLTEAFHDYLMVEALHILDKMGFAKPLSFRLGDRSNSLRDFNFDEPCFVIDISLQFEKGGFWGRVILPERLREEFKIFFAQAERPPLSLQMQEKLVMELSVVAGTSTLPLADWKKIKIGDFVILDHASFNPETKRGGVTLAIQGKPLFRARYKEGGVKITHYPAYEEVNMVKEKEDKEDEDLYGDHESDEDLFEEISEEAPLREFEGEGGPAIEPEELPIQLSVEMGRINMTVKDLMNLAPGNTLDLQTVPEQGVDLVVNGKKVGRGELIMLGEVLGVRILSF